MRGPPWLAAVFGVVVQAAEAELKAIGGQIAELEVAKRQSVQVGREGGTRGGTEQREARQEQARASQPGSL